MSNYPLIADHPKRPSSRRQVGEQQRCEDVYRWNQHRRANALQDGVANDQHSKPRRDGAEHRTNGINSESEHEKPLPAVAVSQFAARDHERRHHQKKDRDCDLNALDGGVQVLDHVRDHHIHVRAGKAADELSEG